MFRRSKSTADTSPADQASTAPVDRATGKGRPTPSRREQEAAAKARAKVPRTRKEQAAQQRLSRADSSKKMREAMRTGDERYLPPRDRGPVRRFIRDLVDSRISFMELLLPLLVLNLLLGFAGSSAVTTFGSVVLYSLIVLVIVDMIRLRFRVRKEVAKRFPDASTKGNTYYAIVRAMQMKFMRLPKPQVKIGQTLPERYR